MGNLVTILLIFLIPVLLMIYLQQRKQLQRINQILEEIQQGEVNQRFEIQTPDHAIQDLCGNLNIILDQLQASAEHIQYVETGRKQLIRTFSRELCIPLISMLNDLEGIMDAADRSQEEWHQELKIIFLKGDQLSARLQHFFELVTMEKEEERRICNR